jgi:hypothetical protein
MTSSRSTFGAAPACPAPPDLGSVVSQVKSTMLVTLWVFIGIEGRASIRRAPRTAATLVRRR